MNGSIRVSAKTVDDAITEALIQLGVTSDRLEYEVIEKGSAGFLGIGMKQAVIEARRKPEPKEEKVEEPVVEEPVRVEPKKVEAVQPQKAAAEKKADEPQKAAFEKAVEKEAKEEVKKETKLVEVQPQTIKAVEDFLKNTMKAMDMEVELKTEIDQEAAEKSMARTEAIIYSMTPEERRNPSLMNPSRKNRIAKGAGVDIAEVNRLVKQFEQMKKMMKQMPGMMKKGKRGMFKGLPF